MVRHPHVQSGATELNANSVYNWMKNYGGSYGWSTASTTRIAQDKANSGCPVVGLYYNSGGHGHVIVVRPETAAYPYSSAKGPVIAQAGSSNFNYGYPTIAVSRKLEYKLLWIRQWSTPVRQWSERYPKLSRSRRTNSAGNGPPSRGYKSSMRKDIKNQYPHRCI